MRPRVEPLEPRVVPAGTWIAFTNLAPAGLGTMMLLSDGSFMAQGADVSSAWYRLMPGSDGGYASSGTWSTLAPMNLQRLYFASNVLPDGRVLVLGGEYSGPQSAQNLTNTGEVYNPVTNGWSGIANFPQSRFGDDPSMVLDNGQVLLGYVSGAATYLYNPTTNTYTQTGTKLRNERSDEETWLKLPDGSVLSYDVFNDVNNGQSTAQRYVPATGTWVDVGTVPVNLSSSALGYELGGATMLPDGRAWFVGATGHTAFYTPATNSWTAGPDLPNGQHADDAPLCLLVNGHVLLAADGPGSTFNPPTHIYDYDPVANSFTEVDPPPLVGSNRVNAYTCRMLALPNGTACLEVNGSNQLYAYTPDSGPQPSWAPTVSGITSGTTFTLIGTQLNGMGKGASYGDDAEMDSNFPIVEYLDASGNFHYARTFNWSSTDVQTGGTLVSTNYTLPAGVVDGAYRVQVVANGIASSATLHVVMDASVNNVTLAVDASNSGLYDVYNGGTLQSQWTIGSFSSVIVTMEGTGGTVTIPSVPAGVPVNVYGGGSSTITIGNAGSLAGIQGPIDLENPGGLNTVTIDDSADTAARTATLRVTSLGTILDGDSDTAVQLSGLAPSPISWESSDTAGATIQGGSGDNTWNVNATSSGPPISILAGGGNDTFDLGDGVQANGLDNLAGALTIDGGAGTNLVNVNDSSNSAASAYTVTSSTVSRSGFGGLTYSGLASLVLDGGAAGDSYAVTSTAAGEPVTINAGATANTATLGGGNLDNLAAAVTYDGGSSGDLVTIGDTSKSGSVSYTINPTNVTRAGAALVTFNTVAKMTLDGGSGANTYNVAGTAAATPIVLNGGAANDTFNISSSTNTLDSILGAVTVAGNGGTDAVNVQDSGTSAAETYHLATTSSLTRSNAGTLTYGTIEALNVTAGLGNDSFFADVTPTLTANVDLGGGSNTLTGPNAATTWQIKSAGGGLLGTALTFANVQNLTGGTNTDTFKFVGLSAGVSGMVNGGSSTNTLDYSDNGVGAVAVNLATSAATSTGGFKSIGKLVGNSTTTLTGLNASSTWSITGADTGTVGSFSWTATPNLTGGTATDTFKFVGAGASESGTIAGGAGTNTLDYSGNGGGAIAVNLATGAATSTGGFTGIGKLVGSSAATDTLTGPSATNNWSITGANVGTVGSFAFSAIEQLVGGTGVDVFKFTAAASSIASIDGGGAPTNQGDWLDYSTLTTAVTVNLSTGAATDVTGSISNLQDVHGGNGGNTLTGSSQGNILIGGTGSNTITGGSGRSILIGDKGPSTITGGSGGSAAGGDILIAGTNSFDTMTTANEAALMSILAEWQSADPATTRFTDINTGTGGGLNGTNKLNWTSTVLDNGKANTLTGAPSSVAVNWYFANEAAGHTQVFNRNPGDHTNNS